MKTKEFIIYPEEKDFAEGEMPEMDLKVGMGVKIYQKPYTREDFEGVAIVSEIFRGPERTNGFWEYSLGVFFPCEKDSPVCRKVFLD